MRKRMYALVMAGVLIFSQAGLVVMAQDTPIQSADYGTRSVTVTPEEKELPAAGGSVTFKTSDGDFEKGYQLEDETGNVLVKGTDYEEYMVSASILALGVPENTGDGTRVWYLVVNGEKAAVIRQAGKSTVQAKITEVKENSVTILPDGRTEVVYEVKGSGLEEVGVKVKEGFNTTIPTGDYEVKRDGSGEKQIITVTFRANQDEWDWKYTVHFYPTLDTTGNGEQQSDVTIHPAGEIQEAVVESVEADKETTEWNDTKVGFTVKGTNLTADNFNVKVTDAQGEPVDIVAGEITGSSDEQKFEIDFPENPYKENAVYTVSVWTEGSEPKTADVMVSGKSWEIEQTISKITADQTELSGDDRTVTFTLEGENLSRNTAVKVTDENKIRQDISSWNVKVEGKGTKQTVAITFPENGSLTDDVVYNVNFAADGSTWKKFDEQIKVKKKEAEAAKVTAVTADKQSLGSEGGVVTFTVLGSGLNSHAAVKVLKNGMEDSSLTPIFTQNTEVAQVFTLNLPKNDTDQAVIYTIKAAADQNTSAEDWKQAVVTVAGKTQSAPEVTAISANPENVPEAGGKVRLTVSGAGLTAENWGVEVKTYISGTEVERPNQSAEVTEITAEGAVLTIPRNTMQNQMEYRVTAGVRDGDSIQEQAKTIIRQEKKGERVDLELEEAALMNTHLVVATFTHDVESALSDESELKSKITLSGYQYSEKSEPGILGEGDSVAVEGNQVKITLASEYEGTVGSRLDIAEGALKRDGVVGKAVFAYLVTKPRVSSVDYEEDIFDYNGGIAIAHLTGVRLQEVKNIEAKILNPGNGEEYPIAVDITPGETPVLKFEVPKNETDKTQSYLLSLEIDQVPVYEGTAENQAKRAIVSVLPKGTDKDAQTLSEMTITGNNKIESTDQKNIEVVVSKQEGELKTKLKLSGTNLDSTKTEVRAIDENGVVWPVYHVPE